MRDPAGDHYGQLDNWQDGAGGAGPTRGRQTGTRVPKALRAGRLTPTGTRVSGHEPRPPHFGKRTLCLPLPSSTGDWLKAEFGLGHGHAMAVLVVIKDNGWTHAPAK